MVWQIINKLRIVGRLVRALIPSIWFNFKYLPLEQAVRLPILVYKPNFVICQGNIILKFSKISFGKIQLGFPCSSLYPNTGISIKIRGNIIFHGKTSISNASSIEVGECGTLEFGENFVSTGQLKIGCHKHITFGTGTLVSWDNIFIDTDYHALQIDGEKYEGISPIIIGNYNWFGFRCATLKGSKTPDYAVIACNTLVNSDLRGGNYVLIAGTPAKIVRHNIWRNPDDDKINYSK